MTPHRIAFAALCAALVACTAQQSPADVAQPTGVLAPAATATPAPSPQVPAAKRAPGDENRTLSIFRAFGNEPFWNVNVEDASLTFTTPEDQVGVVMQGERHSIADGLEITGSHEGKAFALSVVAGACTDGMSDNRYRLVSNFRYGETEYTGCGEPAK